MGCPFTIPPSIFDRILRVIATEGYTTLTAAELVEIAADRRSPPPRACVLTFDDGYADNFVYAHPILTRHGMRASVFVIPARVASGPSRPTLEQAWRGEILPTSLYRLPDFDKANLAMLEGGEPGRDHATAEELIAMHRSGVIEVESHGTDHGCHFVSSQLRGFLAPRSHWTARWALGCRRRLGMPLYEINSSLVRPRYAPPSGLAEALADAAEVKGLDPGAPASSERLTTLYQAMREHGGQGEMEAECAWSSMMEESLTGGRATLGALSGALPTAIAWPFGRWSDPGWTVASRVGYRIGFASRGGGYVDGMTLGGVGRINLKGVTVDGFRRLLLRYSERREVEAAIGEKRPDRPLEYAL